MLNRLTDAKAKLAELVATELQLPIGAVRSGISLRKDLGMDSIAALNILFAVEEAFDLRVSEAEIDGIDDIDTMFELIERHC